jgi:hypothetical protein
MNASRGRDGLGVQQAIMDLLHLGNSEFCEQLIRVFGAGVVKMLREYRTRCPPWGPWRSGRSKVLQGRQLRGQFGGLL